MKSQITYSLIILALAVSQCGQSGKVKPIQNGIDLKTRDLNVRVQFYADDIARVMKWRPESSA